VEEARKGDAFDASWGFERLESGPPKLGWLLNMRTTSIVDLDGSERSALDLYLLQQDGSTFKATLRYSPYFYLDIKKEHVKEVTALLERKFGPLLDGIVPLAKVDLDMPNHLSGLLHIHLKLSFRNTEDLYSVKRDLLPIVIKNRRNAAATDAYSGGGGGGRGGGGGGDSFGAPRTGATLGVGLGSSRRRGGLGYGRQQDAAGAVNYAKSIIDLREYDVPYHMRVAIDNDIRVGAWFIIRPLPASAGTNAIAVEWQRDMVLKAEPRVLAFDIECCKAPLKFPVADVDEIFMISYMIDGRGYLIISRTVVSEDIEDFEYTPKPSYPGPFHIFNEPNEEALLRRFIDHCKELRPNIFVTYNGDFFDWPYIDKRCEIHGISMESELGVAVTRNGEYRGRCAVHMDAFCWVKRDSYLPQGSQGLKAVTKYKLGYDPVEVDPEDMVPFAKSQPKLMASYSVSDAVATYYLYDKYVHLFVFSLATIIPLPSEDVLRKGSGTLCEALLMVEAYRGGIICPNKQVTPRERFKDGHPLESDTYVGGHVESIESGIFRSDIPVRFSLEPDAFDELIEGVDRLITYAMEVENGIERAEAVNVDEVRSAIIAQLEMLRDTPRREEMPVIYHLDVAAMYPNIILTNRLQPSAMVDKATCAACDFNHDENACKRHLGWQWRGDTLPLSRSEYESIRAQIRHEEHIDPETGRKVRFRELEYVHQAAFLKVRVKEYCRRVYKKLKETTTEKRVATVCQRENPFYVNTVRSFRDRRYEYKKLKKVWEKKAKKEAKGDDPMAKLEADNKALVYDSLQLAHKCILNSFYGYVMRRGARWYSMSMAATVCDVGANLIMEARKLVERIGRPLELDTDGIWCILPASFPENFKIKLRNGSSITLEYPCTMLNVKVHEINTNHQYQSLKVVKQPDAGSGRAGDARPGKVARTGSEGATSPGGVVAHAHSGTAYAMRSENSIFFEVDGPYRAMVLPASTEEGKLLKKRYAVFNFDGTLAELKGFELKRRGELKIIKIFQSQVFEQFLKGDSLVSCYAAVADIANHWLDVIESCGDDMATEEVTDLISEKKFLSRPLADYGAQKSTSITCAKRLSDLLGKEQIAGSGVGTHYIIARSPPGAPVTQRAIPVIIFAKRITPAERRRYLSKWLLDNSLTDEDCDIRAIIDWTYYQDRLSNTIRKIITIPAALQGVSNPVPRVVHPDWLSRNVRNAADPFRQATVTSMFGQVIKGASYTELPEGSAAMDIEDMMGGGAAGGPAVARVTRPGQQQLRDTSEPPEIEREIAMEEDFPAWLKQRKRWWKGQRSARKVREMELLGMNESDLQATGPRGRQSAKARKRNTAKARAAAKKRGGASVGQFLAQAGRAVSHGYWQLVEFRATATPGRYRIFALTSPTTMQTIDIEVPRTLIVNTSQGDDVLGDLCAALNDLSPDDKENALRGDVVRIGGGAGAGRAADMPTRTRSTPSRKSGDAAAVATYRSVRRTLPRAIESVNLYALQVPETVARMPPKPLHLFLTDSETRGVYEANSPLVMQCVLALGCVARVSAKARARRFEGRRRGKDRSAFKLSELDRLDTTSHAYLEPERAVYRKVYLYHCKSVAKAGKKGQAGRARSLWAIVDFEGTSADAGATKSASCTVVIANPFAQVGARPDFSGIFDEIRVRAGAASAGWQGDDATCTFAVETVKTDAAAITAIDRVLGEMQRAQRGPTFVLAQTPLNLHQLTKALPVLHEFPVITMESNLSDNAFPPFEWQTHAAQRFLQRALLAPDWWSDRVECARYAHIPVGNLKVDNAVHMADVFFARLLEQNNHVTWTSPAVLPDLGGRETEEAFSVEPNESPTMSNPGVFRTVCIELELSHLAVNTMLEAAHIHAIEGGDGYLSLAGDDLTSGAVDSMVAARAAAAADNETEGVQIKMGATSLDSSVACRDAFKVLRVMITQWLDDVSETGNPYADHLLLHFYRWLCSSRSQLYDPALHAMVHGMMSKVFHQVSFVDLESGERAR
tara:strand:+ start:251 stop:6238 length:5988 start_codon:yes stop_codon:yes gene_type:complete